jgi:Peptidase A4 family
MNKTVLSGAIASAAALAVLAGPASAATAPDGTEAGYQVMSADIGTAIHTVSVSWVEPQVIPSRGQNEYSSIFAGFDNAADTGLAPCCSGAPGSPQLGSEADSVGDRAQYYAWYSPAPGGFGRVVIKETVRPGDHLTASLTASGSLGLNDTMKLTDTRDRARAKPLTWTKVIKIGPADNAGDVEGAVFGVAAPETSSGGANLLADFRSVHFTGASVNGHALGSYGANANQYYFYGICEPVASSSGVGRGGTFTVHWLDND